MTEKIGLEAIWDNQNFNKGNAEYISKIAQANTQTAATSTGINQLGASTQSAGGLFASLAGMLGMSTGGLITLVSSITAGIVSFKLISNAVNEFIGFMIQGEDSAVKMASRVQELNLAAQAMGQMVGMDGEQVQALVKQLTSMEISGKDANQVVADFARYGLNMAQVLDLATVAENASVLTGKSATETFADLSTGIQRMMVRQLKSSGIVMNANDAYQKYADILGKDKDALTETEQQQAFLNEVIAKGANLQGLHAVAMQTAAEQMDHFSAKVIPDLKLAMGAPFQAAYYNVIKGISDLVTEFTKLISEGGALYPIMVNIGAIFKIITEPILGLGDVLTDFSTNKLGGAAASIMQTISNAFTWGENLVINFANGIINAASTVLVSAINFMAGILTFWMSPGSPPKFIPNIDQWGSEAMQEYLRGFTEADFSVLNDLQSPIEQVLGSLADMGAITKQAASQLYVDLSESMIQALSSGGLTSDLLAQLTAAGGMYGDELVDLAKKEFALSDAEKAVTENEKALNDAKKRAVEAGAKVNTGLMEYNQMLRGGASKQALAAKLAEINANKRAQIDATKDIDTKQAALDLAKEQLIATQDQVKAIKDMLKVMLDLNKAQIVAVTPTPETVAATPAAKAAGGAAKAGAAGAGETPTFDPSKISNAFTEAVNKAANEMKNKLSLTWIEITGKIKLAWDTMMVSLWLAWYKSGLANVWETVKTKAGEAWEGIKKEVSDAFFYLTRWFSQHGADIIFVFQKIGEFLGRIFGPGFLVTAVAMWNGLVAIIKIAWSIIWGFIRMALEIIGGLFSAFADILRGNWAGAWEDIKNILVRVWKIAQQTVNDVLAAIGTYISDTMTTIHTIWGDTWDKISQKVTDIWNAIKTWISDRFGEINTIIVGIATDISAKWTTFWDGVSTKVTDIWNAIVTWVTTKITEAKTTIGTISGEITTAWNTFWDDASTKVTDIWDAIVKGVGEKIQSVKDTIASMFTDPTTGIFAKFIGWATDMATAGGDLIVGLKEGIAKKAAELIESIKGTVQGIIDAILTLLGVKHSPSWITDIAGSDLMRGLGQGIEASISIPEKAMNKAMMRTLAPAAAIPVTMGATTNYYQPNFNMPTTINNGMNAAVFQASVKRIVRNEINRK